MGLDADPVDGDSTVEQPLHEVEESPGLTFKGRPETVEEEELVQDELRVGIELVYPAECLVDVGFAEGAPEDVGIEIACE